MLAVEGAKGPEDSLQASAEVVVEGEEVAGNLG